MRYEIFLNIIIINPYIVSLYNYVLLITVTISGRLDWNLYYTKLYTVTIT